MEYSGGPCEGVECRDCTYPYFTTRVTSTVDNALEQQTHVLAIETDVAVEEIKGSFAKSPLTIGSKSKRKFEISAKSANGKLNVSLRVYFK